MGKRLIGIVLYKVYCMKILSHDELRKMRYGMEVISNELTKIVILLIIFIVLDELQHFLFSLIVLVTIRCLSGGIHFQSNLKCLLFSVVFFIAAVFAYIYPFFDFPGCINLIILTSAAIIGILSPLPSANRPICSRKRYLRLKLASVLVTTLWSYILIFLVEDHSMRNCGIATIVLQSAQLVAGKMLLMYKYSLDRRVEDSVK